MGLRRSRLRERKWTEGGRVGVDGTGIMGRDAFHDSVLLCVGVRGHSGMLEFHDSVLLGVWVRGHRGMLEF